MRLRTLGGLWIEDSGAAPGAGPRPRPLALLAFLAAAGAGGVSRARVMGVLWPDADEERARHALSQTLYSLRRDLGAEVVVAAPTLRLDPERITSDVADLRAAVAARRWPEAAALYAGPFLEHFHLADAPEFERWAEAERAALATAAIRAIEIVAKASAESGRPEEAAEHWHHLARLDPVDSRIAASYMEALAALGDRAAAVAHGRAHAELLRREYEADPDPTVQRLMARLREPHATAAPAAATSVASVAPRAPEPTYSPEVHAPPTPPALPALPAPPPHVRGPLAVRRRVGLAVAGVVAVGVATVLGWRAATRRPPPPVLAVGRIRDLAAPDSAAVGAVLREMLATSLGRLPELQVVANSRMLELTPRDADTSRSAFTDAARRAGATEVVEGELIPLPDRQLRLEVRRVDLERGLVRGGYRVAGGDRFALFDSVTALIAADLRVGAPAGSLAEVSTRSPVAYRLYEEGVRAMYQYDAFAAHRLFQAALREDSTFPMATYYAWRMARGIGDPAEWRLAPRALALASRAPPRERLLIVAQVGGMLADLRARAAAETLATNYPRDPEALVRAADVIQDLPRAVALYDRAIAIDSAAGPASVLCRLCDALASLVGRYQSADSSDAVFRTLRRWQALRPSDAIPWAQQANWLIGLGRRAEAEAATRRSEALGGPGPASHLGHLAESLRLDELEAADRDCAAGLASPDSAAFQRYRWYCVIALRMEGRYREAKALVREGRVPRSAVVRRGGVPDVYLNGILAMETGDGLTAADEFHEIYPTWGDSTGLPDGYRARYETWALTLSATAAVAGGDTLRARHLVDSIEAAGQRSLYPRDPPLHHFVRGLLESRAGRHEAAVREYRAALVSPAYGYTRINYELGRSLLALGRPGEAIRVVQPPLHGGLEGEQLYVTRTELHELLAQLFDAAGQRDSAAAHYAVVERSWRSADPSLRPRREAARQWLARAGRAPAP